MLHKLLLFFIFYFIFITHSYAITLLDDNFDSINNINWNYVSQGGSIISENGVLKLGSTGYSFPIVYSKINNLFSTLDKTVFEVRFMFENISSMGNGISVGVTDSSGWPYYQFSVWNDSYSGLRFVSNNFNTYNYNFCNISVPDDPRFGFVAKSLSLTNNNWHKFRIEKNGTQYNIYFDKEINPVPILSTSSNQCIPKNIFIGNPLSGGNLSWTSLNIDYIKIGDGLWSGNSQNKIIFLPGMGASWNERAMVLNQNVAQNEWRMTPFVKNYDQMFKGFDDNGLVKGTDYFVYNYDWRKPLASQITDFDSYVNSLNLAAGEKIDVVGHSLGGVIGRIWTQENSSKVGKVLTLGSPNSGAVTTYEMWNGAKISNPTETSSIALNILLALQKKNNQTAVDTLRTYVPIVKDLLPTFNYLKKNGVIVVPPANTYLTSKNSSVSSIFPQLLAVSGLGFNTVSWINLSERSVFDSILNQWESGKPISYTYSDGDGTVLKNSAVFNGDGSTSVTSNHGNVPDKSVNLVLTELGLGKTIADIANSNFNGAVFYLGSPATIKVNCGGGDLSGTDGFVLVANKNISDCTVKLTGTDNGTYHLVMGNSNDNESWKYSEGNIVVDQNKNISVNVTDFWYEQMLRETNLLLSTYPSNANLKNMVVAINAKNRTNLLNYYLLFRKQKLENIITWRMVNYLERIINLELPIQTVTVIEKQKVLALSAKALADKTSLLLQRSKLLPNQWQSLNYNQGDDLILGNNYGKYLLAEKILGMVWY